MSLQTYDINAMVAAHGCVARVVIAQFRGSSPREIGASMLVWDGGQSGTIGGGALEYLAATNARTADANFASRHALGPDLGQCCGGHVELVTEVFDTPLPAGLRHSRRISGDAPCPIQIASADKRARAGEDCGQILWQDGWLSEPATPAKRPLWVWGAGHVGRAVVGMAALCPEFAVTWIDTDATRFPADLPADVTAIPAADPVRLIPHAPADAEHLIFTYSHALDFALCDAALARGFRSCGVIGSNTKWARFSKRLSALGHDPARITCPIGDPGLGKTPSAIALGVLTGLVSRQQIKNRDTESWKAAKSS